MTCHCNDTTTFICPNGNCSVPSNGNGCGCGCNCPPDSPLPETHRVNRLIAPSRGTHTYWTDKDPVIFEGVIGLTKDRLFPGSLEYFIGDGAHKYSELPKYGGAEASILSKAYTLVLRDADGKIDSSSIDFPEVPDATPTSKGVVKASTTKAGDNVVKADADGGLGGWKDAISEAIANPDTGLVKNADGTLGVDFDLMPTTKFEALLKSLKMQIPLEANLNLYVDQNHANASDTIEDGRGTQAKPFKTINACVAYATQTYAVGKYTIYINVAQGTYNENVTLPFYNRTSGSIILRATDYDAPPTVTNTGPATTPVQVSGGSDWTICRINVICDFSAPNDSLQHFPGCIHVSGGSSVTIQGCALSATYSGDAHSAYFEVRMLFASSGSTITFYPLTGYQNSFTCHKGNASSAVVLAAERSGVFNIYAANTPDDGIMYNIPCSGEMSVFARANQTSAFFVIGGATYFQQFTGSMTGTRYRAAGGSNITAPSNGFPGDVDGSVDTATYSWYSGPSL